MKRAVTPQDIAEIMTPAEQMAVFSQIDRINSKLIRQRFAGPETFRLPLPGALTEGARKAIVRPYLAHWRNPRIVEERHDQGDWVFCLEALGAPVEEGWDE